MLIINVEHSEGIDRAVKRYKRKYRDTKILRELRSRKHYVKPSVRKRAEKLSAKYRNKMFGTSS